MIGPSRLRKSREILSPLPSDDYVSSTATSHFDIPISPIPTGCQHEKLEGRLHGLVAGLRPWALVGRSEVT